MGNTSSQPFSDGEGGPQYRHHETVLRDAQRRLPLHHQVEPVECLSDEDEQFYSAEEGDSSRSVTPERRRPESSSGEEQLSDDESMDEEVTASGGGASPLSSSFEQPRNLILRSKRRCGKCNVSAFQEHDSIGPELISAGGATVSPVYLQNGSHKRLHSPANAETKSPKQIKLRPRGSPFQPICSGSRQQRLISCLNNSLSPGKRKYHSDKDEMISTREKVPSESPTKKIRLGYFDSSESEGEEVEQRGRKRHKRGKLNHSVKKQKKINGSSTESSSDEDTHKKMKASEHSCSEENNSGLGLREQRKNQTKLEKSLQGRGKNGGASEDEENTTEIFTAPQSPRKRNLRDRLTLMATPKDVESPVTWNKGKESQKETRQNRSFQGFDQNTADSQVSELQNRSLNGLPSEIREGTGKMGNQAARNAQGKLLPLQQFRSPTLSQSQSEILQSSRIEMPKSSKSDTPSQASDSSNITKRLRQTSGAFMSLQPSRDNSRSATVAQNDGGDFSLSAYQSIDKEREDSGILTNEKNEYNPFQTVELTPPSKSSSFVKTSLPQEDKDHISPTPDRMEIDDLCFQENTAAPTRITRSNERPIATPKRQSQSKSIAERFRNFWSKKKVGSNLKSLLSKTEEAPCRKAPSAGIETTSYQVYRAGSSNLKISPPQRSDPTPVTFLTSGRTDQTRSAHSSPKSHAQSPPTTRQQRILPSPFLQQTATLGHPSAAVESLQRRRRTSPRQVSQNASVLKSPALRSLRSAVTSSTVVQILPPTSHLQVLHAQLAKCLTVSVSLGELAEASAAGLVNWTDGNLTHTVTACSQAVVAKAGALLIAGCVDYLENKGSPLEAPDVLTTLAGGRFHESVEAILHVVAPPVGSMVKMPSFSRKQRQEKHGHFEDEKSRALLLQVYANCLRFAEERLGLSSIAFPLVGQGEFSIATCVQCFYDSLLLFLHEQGFPSKTPSICLSSVQLIIADARTTDLAVEHLQACLDRLSGAEHFVSAITEISTSYFKQDQLKRYQSDAEEASSIVSSEDEKTEAVQAVRVLSGRPRVKRPRL